jgi:hypothetical protein
MYDSIPSRHIACKLTWVSQQPSIIRLGVLLLLFDVYLTWARIEKQTAPDSMPGESNLGKLAQQPIVFQYLFFRKLHQSVI